MEDSQCYNLYGSKCIIAMVSVVFTCGSYGMGVVTCLYRQKMGPSENSLLQSYLTTSSSRIPTKRTASELSSIFGERTPLFNKRHNCCKIARYLEEFVPFGDCANTGECFRYNKIGYNQNKLLIPVSGYRT